MTDQELKIHHASLIAAALLGQASKEDVDEVAELLAEFSASLLSRAIPEGHVVVPGWLPIETAPAMNGGSTKAVLVWCPSNKCMFTAHFDIDNQLWKYFSGTGGLMFVEPTHWMPLPAAPANKEGT